MGVVLNDRAHDGGRAAATARCAWLLAVDLAFGVVDGAVFVRIYATPEKVGRGSDARTAMARKIACYLAVTVANCQPAVLARAAKLDRKTVHSHLAAVEDMRDEPGVDSLLDQLASRMVASAAGLVLANLGEAA